MEARKVLVVDDDKVSRNSICRALKDNYELSVAENGLEGVDRAKAEKPDIILLDVEMPGINGYEVCDQLKNDPATEKSLVVFISSHGGLRERMLGYESGAADYLVKPFDTQELQAKMNHMAALIDQRRQLSQQAQSASKTAFAAMRGSSELGMAIQFIEATYSAKSFDVIAEKFFEVTRQLSLNCTLMFQSAKGGEFFSSKGEVPPLERELVSTLHLSGERFNDFGCRTQINYPRVALLIKNMPLHDQEAYGRYKDFLPTMLGATDAKTQTINVERALEAQTENIISSFNVVRETLLQVGESLEATQHRVLGLLRGIINELDERIPGMGLEDDQEKYLINTLDGAFESTQEIVEGGENASNAFRNVCRLLEHLSERQENLLATVTQEQIIESKFAGGASEKSKITGDVELF